jgi:hypothetical protein
MPRSATDPTRPVRVYDDVGDMLGWVIRLKGATSAERLDPLICPQVEAWYAEVAPEVESIKAAESRHRKVDAVVLMPDLGGEG